MDMLDALVVPIFQALYNLLHAIAGIFWWIDQALLAVGYYIMALTDWLVNTALAPLITSVSHQTVGLLVPIFLIAMTLLGITYLLAVFGYIQIVSMRSAILWLVFAAFIYQVESTVLASRVHLATSIAEDSRSSKKLADCQLTLRQLNEGDVLHEVQIIIAIAAPDRPSLQKAVDELIHISKPYFLLRPEIGQAQLEAAKFFSTQPSKQIRTPATSWQMVSRELALLFAPLGYRKLSALSGTLRGQSGDGHYPFFLNSWGLEKKATHELWVGLTGAGKTFALNINLTRQYIEEGVPFDLLEPMGHGKLLADALHVPHFRPSPQATRLNPLDIMYPDLTEQITHVIRLIETLLGRQFAGTQTGNHQKALIGQALVKLYGKRNLVRIGIDSTPLLADLCNVLRTLGDKAHVQRIAQDVADEVGGLCTGSGPYASFTNAHTNLDLSFRGRKSPRVFRHFSGLSAEGAKQKTARYAGGEAIAYRKKKTLRLGWQVFKPPPKKE